MRDVALELFREGNPVQYGPFMIEHRQRLLEPIDVFGPADVQEVDRREGASFVKALFNITSDTQNITQYVFLLDWMLNKGPVVEYASPYVWIKYTLSRNVPLPFFKQLLDFKISGVTQFGKCRAIFRAFEPYNSEQLTMLCDFIETHPDQFDLMYPIESKSEEDLRFAFASPVPPPPLTVELIHSMYIDDTRVLEKCAVNATPDDPIERIKTARLFLSRFHITRDYPIGVFVSRFMPVWLMMRNEVNTLEWMQNTINELIDEIGRSFIQFDGKLLNGKPQILPINDTNRLNAIRRFMTYYEKRTGLHYSKLARNVIQRSSLRVRNLTIPAQKPSHPKVLPLNIMLDDFKTTINVMNIIDELLVLDVPKAIVIQHIIPLQFGPINEKAQALFPYCVQKYIEYHKPVHRLKLQRAKSGFVPLN